MANPTIIYLLDEGSPQERADRALEQFRKERDFIRRLRRVAASTDDLSVKHDIQDLIASMEGGQ